MTSFDALLQDLTILPMQPDNAESIHLLTAREAARYLRVSLSTLYRMEQQGLLSPLRTPGGHRRYTRIMLNGCLTHETSLASSQEISAQSTD